MVFRSVLYVYICGEADVKQIDMMGSMLGMVDVKIIDMRKILTNLFEERLLSDSNNL